MLHGRNIVSHRSPHEFRCIVQHLAPDLRQAEDDRNDQDDQRSQPKRFFVLAKIEFEFHCYSNVRTRISEVVSTVICMVGVSGTR